MQRSEDYARACAIPKEVSIGGRAFRVSKIGPRMVGELQRWMCSVLEDPRIKARAAIVANSNMPDADARRIWAEAAIEALDWPPDLGSEVGATLILSAEGRARFLFTVACPNESGLTLDLCRGASVVMTNQEWEALQSAVSPRELGDTVDPDPAGEGLNYTEVRAKLCEKYGWTHEYVDGLSFEQIRQAWTDGKPERGIDVEDADDAAQIHRRWREFVYGLS